MDSFRYLEDWTERYQYLIELGRRLPPFPEKERTETNRMHGCQAGVWFVSDYRDSKLHFEATSDSAIVAGLIALLLKVYSGRHPYQVLATSPAFIDETGLGEHLSPHRANGPSRSCSRAFAHSLRRTSRTTSPGAAPDGSRPLQQADHAACRVDIPGWQAGGSRRIGKPRIAGFAAVGSPSISSSMMMSITDYAHELRACVIGQAVASVVAKVIVGLTIDEVDEGAEILSAILQDKRLPPPGPWAEFEPFLPVADVRSRHGSALLPFQALQRAIAEAATGRACQRPAVVSFGPVLRTWTELPSLGLIWLIRIYQ